MDNQPVKPDTPGGLNCWLFWILLVLALALTAATTVAALYLPAEKEEWGLGLCQTFKTHPSVLGLTLISALAWISWYAAGTRISLRQIAGDSSRHDTVKRMSFAAGICAMAALLAFAKREVATWVLVGIFCGPMAAYFFLSFVGGKADDPSETGLLSVRSVLAFQGLVVFGLFAWALIMLLGTGQYGSGTCSA